MVCFHNTINYLTTQINNKTSFETQQRKVYYFSRSKRVRVRKCPFWCRRLICWSLSCRKYLLLWQIARVTDRKAGSSVCEASSRVFFSEGVPSGIRSSGCERDLSWLLTWCSLAVSRLQKRTRKNSSREKEVINALSP